MTLISKFTIASALLLSATIATAHDADLDTAEGEWAHTKNGAILMSLNEPLTPFDCKIVYTASCDRPIETASEVLKVCSEANLHKIEEHHANYLWVQIPPQIVPGEFDKDYEFDDGSVMIHYFQCKTLPQH
ncbi:Uncharacterised protein [BD1-7 clade bacterium]|uniref:Uncharacterized protein n=1 Tax=BD1-7 clade bacterium TaxID=2029982 RepID=A0A5S9QH86_9GAMM|nr:Uncharacterised protein [BD1-7 clade bacterium]CAA0116899.1 Uncharacterised protein [BD1-7 clade bacterium]